MQRPVNPDTAKRAAKTIAEIQKQVGGSLSSTHHPLVPTPTKAVGRRMVPGKD